jgi:hypothetical protein
LQTCQTIIAAQQGMLLLPRPFARYLIATRLGFIRELFQV